MWLREGAGLSRTQTWAWGPNSVICYRHERRRAVGISKGSCHATAPTQPLVGGALERKNTMYGELTWQGHRGKEGHPFKAWREASFIKRKEEEVGDTLT